MGTDRRAVRTVAPRDLGDSVKSRRSSIRGATGHPVAAEKRSNTEMAYREIRRQILENEMPAGFQVLDRMIGTVVAKFHLHGARAAGEA